jgi:hypothetical protein
MIQMKPKERKRLRQKLLEKKAVVKFAEYAGVAAGTASSWLQNKTQSRKLAKLALEFEKIIDSNEAC